MPHPRLAFHTWPAAVYAIGDIHGCLDRLLELEDKIAADALNIEGEKWLITLGDHIDRGPSSAAVIKHLMGPPPSGFRRLSLLGNHEVMLLNFLGDPDAHAYWLDEGGAETLTSYARMAAFGTSLADWMPDNHVEFIQALPLYLSLPGWLFVHAGIRPGVSLAMQTEDDLVWIRAPFLTSQLTGGLRVVHGHTPGDDIVVTPHRIDVDTRCFASGKLSAVRVMQDGSTKFFSVQG
jgi:serine/threonine protein phosphatase 1